MSQITWDTSYSVNNELMDSQHQKWIAIYNQLDHALLHGDFEDISNTVVEIFQAMKDYADYHFRQEERYLQEIDYPDLVAHKRLHSDFDNQLFSYNRKLQNDELILGSEVMNILKNWLQHHILEEDQKYTLFIKEDRFS